jgi:N-acetylglucosamine kinase-like BadF-type ATPase
MTAFLAVDGGNSKTDVLVCDPTGRVLGHARGPGTNHQTAGGVDEAMRRLAHLVAAARGRAGLDDDEPLDLAAVYLAGADLPAELAMLTEAVAAADWARKSIVDNDTFAVLRAGTDEAAAVAVVCGAGINCVGRAADGRVVRFPALGTISGDWGGGETLGMQALWHAVRAEDGRGQPTALTGAVAAHFGFATVAEVSAAAHVDEGLAARFGELCPVLFRVAAAGDEVARTVIVRQGEEIATLAGAALRRLGLTDVPVVLGGGVLRAGDPLLHEVIRYRLRLTAPAARPVVVTDPPVLGAALRGLDELGAPDAAYRMLRTECGLDP